MSEDLVRPSSLPKLAECRCYEPKPGTSEAAERGTLIDALIRYRWDCFCVEAREAVELKAKFDQLNDEDAEAVRWASDKIEELAMDPFTGEVADVETRESELRAVVPVPGVKPGTMDALCVSLGWLADFKTGQVRDYKAQMAAYALACMDAYFADEWTAHLLFVDQQEVVTHLFNREDAEALVLNIVTDPKVETRCDYCKWCGRAAECGLMREACEEAVTAPALPACTAEAKSKGELPEVMEAMLSDHAKAHEFLSKFAVVSDWVEVLKSKLKDSVQDGNPYFNKVVVPGHKVVMPLQLSRYGKELGFDRLLRVCSAIPVSKVQEIWSEVFSDKPLPEEIVTTQGGSVQLRRKKQKHNTKK